MAPLAMVDSRDAADRRAPRTVAEKLARLAAATTGTEVA